MPHLKLQDISKTIRPCLVFSVHITYHDWSFSTVLSIANTTKILIRSFPTKMLACLLYCRTHRVKMRLMLAKYPKPLRVVEKSFHNIFRHSRRRSLHRVWLEMNCPWSNTLVVSVLICRSRAKLSFEMAPFYAHLICTFLSC